jgi:Putative metal-binding motif
MRRVLLSILCCLAATWSNRSAAIPFDFLDEGQVVFAGNPATVSSSTASADTILGNRRFMQVLRISGSGVLGAVGAGLFTHSQNVSTLGTTTVVWDGVGGGTVKPDGLGGLNLLADDATAFKISVGAFDFPNNSPIQINLFVYDSSDPTGTAKSSQGFVVLNAAVTSPTELLIPFSSLTPLGGALADLSTIGAIVLVINGSQTAAHDLELRFVGTNGRCTHIPKNRLVVDQCGVCNGDNASCSDCEGVPNGPKVAGTSCSTGNLGICGGGTYTGKFPSCGCVQNQQPTIESCDGLDNDCDGTVDEGMGVGETCSSGVGACSASGVKQCGVGGSVVCTAAPGAPSTEICDGIDNDCDGSIDEDAQSGPNTDQCGVCGGDGKSCLDCKGTAFGMAKIDQCGVCGGDGTECLACESFDIFNTLAELDGGAKEQETIVRKSTELLGNNVKSSATKKFIAETLAKAHDLQVRNWILSWQIPQVVTTCESSVLCVTTSNLSQLSEYRQHNTELRNLALAVLRRMRTKSGTNQHTRAKDLRAWAARQHKRNLDLSFTVPDTNFACSSGGAA